MYISQASLDQWAARYGEPQVVRWMIALPAEEMAVVRRGTRDNRAHDITFFALTPSGGVALIRKPSFPNGAWRAPSGGLHVGESLEAGVNRESVEEIGLDINLSRYLLRCEAQFVCGDDVQPWTSHVFTAEANGEPLQTNDSLEIAGARWGTLVELQGPVRQVLLNSGRTLFDYRAKLTDTTLAILARDAASPRAWRIQAMLAGPQVTLLDGAMGTMLQAAGLPPGVAGETWLVDRPEAFLAVQKGYAQAGSQILLSPTFGVNRHRLSGIDPAWGDRVAELCRRGVALTRQAGGEQCLVAGDIGPLGVIVDQPEGISGEEATQIFLEQAEALGEAGVDLFVVETLHTLEEARAAARAVTQVSARLPHHPPLVISFSFDRNRRTFWGLRPGAAAQGLLEARAAGEIRVDAIGANCGKGLDDVAFLGQALADAAPGMPLWIKPNAGLPRQDAAGTFIYDLPPEVFAETLINNLHPQVRLVGGCCGSTPAHIAALAKRLVQK